MSQPPDVRGLARATGPTEPGIPMPARRWRTRVLLPAAILAAVLGLLAYSEWENILPATEVRAMPVIVKSIAGEVPGSITVQAPGWLEPDPFPFYVSALTDGIVTEVLALEGATVEAGDVVARLIDDDAKIARERAAAAVDERRAAVDAAQAELAAAKTTMETLVDHNEAIEHSKAELRAAIAERATLEAEIRAADSLALATADELERKTRLVTTQAVSRGEVARLRLQLAAARARVAARRSGGTILDAKVEAATAQADAAKRRAELLTDERRALAVAQSKLAMARAAERRAVADLRDADLALARTEVHASVSGVVLQRMVAPGSRVGGTTGDHSAHVIHLYDPQQLQVRVDVPLADAALVGVDQRAQIVVDALPDRVFEGRVSRFTHLADVAKNTVEVKVALIDPVPVLKPEMLARVRFLAAQEPNVNEEVRQRIFAPKRAVRRGGGGNRVFAITGLSRGRGRVAVREVKVGELEIEDHVEITSGLRPGDRVIVEAPEGLVEGSRVAVMEGTPR